MAVGIDPVHRVKSSPFDQFEELRAGIGGTVQQRADGYFIEL
jgi:hypothetical protein